MAAVTTFSRTAANNNAPAPDGFPEGQTAGSLNNCARELMKAVVDEATNNACKVLASVAGTNTITASATPDITAYSAGMIFELTPANTNTGATTLNVDSLGALPVLNCDGTACVGGELASGIPLILVLESGANNWVILGPSYASGSFTITLTGVSGTVTSSAFYSRVGRSVCLFIAITQGTSTSTSATLTGLPVIIRPITSTMLTPLVQVVNNSVSENSAANYAQVNTDGTITLYRGSSASGWTAANVKGLNAPLAISYVIV